MKIFILIFSLICFFPLSSPQDQSVGPPPIYDLQTKKQFIWSTYVLTHGVRIPAYQAYPTNKTCHVIEANGVVDTIFSYTNSKQRTHYENSYGIPDFIESIADFKAKPETKFIAFDNLTSFPTLYSEGFKVKGDEFYIHLPYTTGAYVVPFHEACYKGEGSILLQGRHIVKSYEVKMENPTDLINKGRLHKNFFDELHALTEKFEDNSTMYKRFIRIVGTHYWERAEFGNVYLLNYRTTQELFQNKEKELIREIKTAAASQAQYNDYGQTMEYQYYGAGLPFENFDDYHCKNWKKIDSDQWIIGGDLGLISDLIADVAIKTQVEIATQAYLDHKFLDFVKYGLDEVKKTGIKVISPYNYDLIIEANQGLLIPIKEDVELIKKLTKQSDRLLELMIVYNFFKNIGAGELCK